MVHRLLSLSLLLLLVAAGVDTTFVQAQALVGQLQKTGLPHGSLVFVSDDCHLRQSRWVVGHYCVVVSMGLKSG